MRVTTWLPVLILCAAITTEPVRASLDEDNFQLRNTGDLVDVCSVAQSDRLYTAARNFCEGFAVGVFRVLLEQDMARRSNRLFCVPNPPPTRDKAIASFVEWARADTKRLALPAADGLASFFSQQYPCPRGD